MATNELLERGEGRKARARERERDREREGVAGYDSGEREGTRGYQRSAEFLLRALARATASSSLRARETTTQSFSRSPFSGIYLFSCRASPPFRSLLARFLSIV